MINTLLGLVIDLDTMRPVLGGVTGGLSGPAIRPVALRCVWQVHAAMPEVPILGMGGIRTGLDALQLVLAGASAVSVGTAVFNDPSAPARVHASSPRPWPTAASRARRRGPSRTAPGGRPDGRAPFGTRLAAAVAARGPLCVGIDPHASLLVEWGVGDDPDGLRRFTDTVVDALAGSVAVLKPQMAFYERHGSRGLAVLEDAVARIRAAGALVLLDAKRGDIGSTMDAYADYLRPDHPLQVDALTVSPYLGPGRCEPAARTARRSAAGCSCSRARPTPTRAAFQHALVGERSVAQVVVDTVRGWNTPGWVVGDPRPTSAAVRDLASRFGGPPARSASSSAPPCRGLDVDLDGLGGRSSRRGSGAGRLGRRPAAAVRRRAGPSSRRCPGDVLGAGRTPARPAAGPGRRVAAGPPASAARGRSACRPACRPMRRRRSAHRSGTDRANTADLG